MLHREEKKKKKWWWWWKKILLHWFNRDLVVCSGRGGVYLVLGHVSMQEDSISQLTTIHRQDEETNNSR